MRIYRKYTLGECLSISSLPGKASRTLVEWRGLPSDSTSVLEAKPGKRDTCIKRREPGILFISLQAVSLFKLASITYNVEFRVDSKSMRRH